MPRIINIIQKTNTDYDGVEETVKQANFIIDGSISDIEGTFPISIEDSEIETIMDNKATEKGYTW